MAAALVEGVEEIILQAVSFLERSQGAPLERRVAFLRKKGVDDAAIGIALDRVGEDWQSTASLGSPAGHVVFVAPGEAPGHIRPMLSLLKAFRANGYAVTVFADGSANGDREGEVTHTSAMGKAIQRAGARLLFLRDDGRLSAETRLQKCWWGRQFQRLPTLVDDLRSLQPPVAALVYDVFLGVAPVAARICGIPSVGLITYSGPGMMRSSEGPETRAQFDPIRRWLSESSGLDLLSFGLPSLSWYGSSTGLNLVCACEELFCPLTTELQHEHFGHLTFQCVGSMSTIGEAPRAEAEEGGEPIDDSAASLLEEARKAREAGRDVILLSLGTMLVGPFWPPAKLPADDDGGNLGDNDDGTVEPCSGYPLRDCDGKLMAQHCWRVAFQALGARPADNAEGSPEEDGKSHPLASAPPLVIMSVGAKADALDGPGLDPIPPNFRVHRAVPQLRLLPLCTCFITHGGMGSVMEAIHCRVPMLVVPFYGDQMHNAQSVERAGLGVSFRFPLRTLSTEALRDAVASVTRGLAGQGGGEGSALSATDAASYACALEAVAAKSESQSGSGSDAARRACDLIVSAAEHLRPSSKTVEAPGDVTRTVA